MKFPFGMSPTDSASSDMFSEKDVPKPFRPLLVVPYTSVSYKAYCVSSQGPSRSHASIHLSMLIIVFVALVSLSVNLPPHAVTKRHKFPRESALFSSITNVLPSSLNLNLIFFFSR